MKIAVVDDDYTAGTLIADFLEDEGHDVTRVHDPDMLGDAAAYEAIIMDVMIGRDRYAGIDYILKQRAGNKISQKTQVVFISNFGRGTSEIRDRLQRAETYTWLDKPIDLPYLARIVCESVLGTER